MKSFNLIAALIFTISASPEEGRLGREPSDYKYTSLGIDLIQTEENWSWSKVIACPPRTTICSCRKKS